MRLLDVILAASLVPLRSCSKLELDFIPAPKAVPHLPSSWDGELELPISRSRDADKGRRVRLPEFADADRPDEHPCGANAWRVRDCFTVNAVFNMSVSNDRPLSTSVPLPPDPYLLHVPARRSRRRPASSSCKTVLHVSLYCFRLAESTQLTVLSANLRTDPPRLSLRSGKLAAHGATFTEARSCSLLTGSVRAFFATAVAHH